MFAKIIGNEENKKTLAEVILKNKLAHSYMFVGSEGVGKRTFALEFTKKILCLDQSDKGPCNKCSSCIKFENFNHPDFGIVGKEGNSIKIYQIRAMIKKIQEKPIVSNKKIYIIDDSDKMTEEAQNALLKTLEEPPYYAIIILIANNESAFLNTIKSRCTKIKFSKLSNNEIKEILLTKYNKKVDEQEYDIFEGSIKRALQILDKQELYEKIEKFVDDLTRNNLIEIIGAKEKIFKDKDDINLVLEIMNNLLLKKKCIGTMQIVEEAKTRLMKNANYDMTVDNLLISMWEELNG